jgi:ATP-dependent RNA helicase DeaD
MSTENNNIATFASLDLPKPLTEALEIMRYTTPTPIQARGIPHVIEGKDLIGIAQTGTGKTAAFAIPMIRDLFNDKEGQGLVLVPTRELAVQIYEVVRQLTQNMKNLKAWVLVGGTSMYAQVKSLPRKPRLVIATPGRLMDHLDKRTFTFENLKMVVLDEADRMLDIGFEPQIRRIFQKLPKDRQTLLFSATFAKEIEKLTKEYMADPIKLTIGKISEPAKEIDQTFVQMTVGQKNDALIRELTEREGSILVFVRTKHKVDRIARMIADAGIKADRIHGARTQGQRTRVMEDFRKKSIRVLVATDVASRGLDIPHIEHVINFDIPEQPEDYVHRIGRTARAGAKGESISFITSEDRNKWMYLSRHLNSLGAKVATTPLRPFDPNAPKVEIKTRAGFDALKNRDNEDRSDRSERSERRPSLRSFGGRGTNKTSTRYDSNPRGGRSSGRSDSRGPRSDSRGGYADRAPRGEGRSFAPRGPRTEGASSDRSRFARPAGRPDSRGPRSDSRGGYADRAPRGEGRSFAPRGPRTEGASSDRPRFSRPAGRTDSRGPRSDSRSGYGDRAPRGEGRSFAPRTPRPEGDRRPSTGFRKPYGPRTEGASSDRPRFARPAGRTDSRGPRSEGRSFGSRDARPSTGSDRPYARASTRPSSRPAAKPGARYGARPAGSSDGRSFGGSTVRGYTARPPRTTDRPRSR